MMHNILEHWTSGSFSQLFVDSNHERCYKHVMKLSVPPHNSKRELAILQYLQNHPHEHVAPLLEFEEDENQFNLILVFPFYEQRLLEFIPACDSTLTVYRILSNVASALYHLHSLGILHRDICPNNIMVTGRNNRWKAVLIDMSIAWSSLWPTGEEMGNLIPAVGTGSFRAPELLFGCRDYDRSIDLWALGCTFAQVLHQSQETLFDAGDCASDFALISSIFKTIGTPTVTTWKDAARLDSFRQVQFLPYTATEWSTLLPGVDTSMLHIVRGLVTYNTTDRWSAFEVLRAIERAIIAMPEGQDEN